MARGSPQRSPQRYPMQSRGASMRGNLGRPLLDSASEEEDDDEDGSGSESESDEGEEEDAAERHSRLLRQHDRHATPACW